MTNADRLEQGLIFFNDGRYFEAHEIWEDAWRDTTGPLRHFYQGLIQAAVALHHLGRANTTGARSQLAKSIRNLKASAGCQRDVDSDDLIRQLELVLIEMRPRNVRIVGLK